MEETKRRRATAPRTRRAPSPNELATRSSSSSIATEQGLPRVLPARRLTGQPLSLPKGPH
jgi:hypothetical protein